MCCKIFKFNNRNKSLLSFLLYYSKLNRNTALFGLILRSMHYDVILVFFWGVNVW